MINLNDIKIRLNKYISQEKVILKKRDVAYANKYSKSICTSYGVDELSNLEVLACCILTDLDDLLVSRGSKIYNEIEFLPISDYTIRYLCKYYSPYMINEKGITYGLQDFLSIIEDLGIDKIGIRPSQMLMRLLGVIRKVNWIPYDFIKGRPPFLVLKNNSKI